MKNSRPPRSTSRPSLLCCPTGILQRDFDIIDEQDDHVVLTVRVPLDLIRDNHALWKALSEIAAKPRAPADPDIDDAEGL